MDLRLKDISNQDHATKNKSIPEVEKHYTKATLPMDEKRTTAFVLMEIDEAARMVEFAKKFKGGVVKHPFAQSTRKKEPNKGAGIESKGPYCNPSPKQWQGTRRKICGIKTFL
ncbi:hypothetical protein I3760_09G114200 [Carya illinoinensis]|nr:hypothetical protein I3760_09G114200 [Carya illinoinensis]